MPLPARILGHTKREWASLFYSRRLGFLDILNNNAEFKHAVKTLFVNVKEFPPRDGVTGYYDYVHSSLIRNEQIDYLEFGVYKGESLEEWCRLNTNPQSRFFGFDTFEGLPEDWNPMRKKGAFDVEGAIPQLDDPRVRFVKGLFQESLYPFLDGFRPQGRLVIHIDADLYSSALFCLAAMDRFLSAGSILMFDEFYDLSNEFAAFRDYTKAFYRNFTGVAYTTAYNQAAFCIADHQRSPSTHSIYRT
jgi:O-methyltransferase